MDFQALCVNVKYDEIANWSLMQWNEYKINMVNQFPCLHPQFLTSWMDSTTGITNIFQMFVYLSISQSISQKHRKPTDFNFLGLANGLA